MTTNNQNSMGGLGSLLDALIGQGGIMDIGDIMTPKGMTLCKLATDAEIDSNGNMKLKCGTLLHFAEEALAVADHIAGYAHSQNVDVIVSVSHKDTILAAYASGLKGSPAFGVFTQDEKGKNVIEGPDTYPARSLKFLIACLALGDGERIAQAARTIREQFPNANIVGAYAVIDYEQNGMSVLADNGIPLQRLFTKSDIIAHQEIHKKSKDVIAAHKAAQTTKTPEPQPVAEND
jgi:orotate phosphoribosyltransferase